MFNMYCLFPRVIQHSSIGTYIYLHYPFSFAGVRAEGQQPSGVAASRPELVPPPVRAIIEPAKTSRA